MITVFKTSERGLEILPDLTSGSWVNIVDPTPDEINRLQQELDVPQDFLMYPLDIDERSRTEKEDNALLIILRIPYYQGVGADVPYTTIPLGIILTDAWVVTVCKMDNAVLQEMAAGRIRGLSTSKRNRFVLHLLLNAASRYLSDLRNLNKMVDIVEDKLERSQRNREVLELLKYEKSLVYFSTALKSNELMMERLQKSQMFRMYPDDEDLLEDVLTENQQAIEMVGIANNILAGMMDAFASIISNNLNAVMKFLASITILMAIPTSVASFYGMNVDLPLAESPQAFLLILVLCFAMSLTAIWIFWKNDWF